MLALFKNRCPAFDTCFEYKAHEVNTPLLKFLFLLPPSISERLGNPFFNTLTILGAVERVLKQWTEPVVAPNARFFYCSWYYIRPETLAPSLSYKLLNFSS